MNSYPRILVSLSVLIPNVITSNIVLAILFSKLQTINNTVQKFDSFTIFPHHPLHIRLRHTVPSAWNDVTMRNTLTDRDDDSVVSSPPVAFSNARCRMQSASLVTSYICCNWPHVRVDTLPSAFNVEWRWRVLWIHEHTGRDTWGRRFACRMPRVTSQGTSVVHPSTPGTRWQNELFPLNCRFLPYDLPHCLLGRVY